MTVYEDVNEDDGNMIVGDSGDVAAFYPGCLAGVPR